MSGRRSTELVNGTSVFNALPAAYGPFHVAFSGQLKKKGAAEQAAAYVIPVLMPHRIFDHGLAVLRKMQSGDEARMTA